MTSFPEAAAALTAPLTCGTCRWRLSSGAGKAEEHVCRRYPPTPIALMMNDALGRPAMRMVGQWAPITPRTLACGEYGAGADRVLGGGA